MVLTPNRSNIPFFEAPRWNQDIASAKADFLELSDEFIKAHKAEFGTVKALKRCLQAVNRGLIGREIKEKLRGKPVSKTKYYRWVKAYKREGLSGLLEKYGNQGPRTPSEIGEAEERLIWENHECTYQDVYNDLCVMFGKYNVPCYTTIRSHVKRYKKENWAALVLHHEGQKGLRDRGMNVAIGRMDADLTQPNQRWEIDTTLGDIFDRDGRRWKIVQLIDVFSRCRKYYLVEKEDALTIARIIRDRIIVWGKPKEIIFDNGGPYNNRRIRHFLDNAGIDAHYLPPASPEKKAHVERTFRDLSDFLRRLPGYTGNCVANKPSEIELKYSREEIEQLIDDWTESVIHERVHRSTEQRPRERMSPPGFVHETIAERDLDILLMEEYTRKVRQGHIAYKTGKYFHPQLPEGQDVTIRPNDFDASEILVFLGGKFLCVAEEPMRKGWTPQQIKKAKQERTQELRTRIKAHGALIDKQSPKDARVLALLDHHKKLKPAELPKKAEVIEFPALQNIPYARPETVDTHTEELDRNTAETKDSGLIRSNQEMYLDIMKRRQSGQALDDVDRAFLEEFLISNEYRLLGSHLRKELTRRAS